MYLMVNETTVQTTQYYTARDWLSAKKFLTYLYFSILAFKPEHRSTLPYTILGGRLFWA